MGKKSVLILCIVIFIMPQIALAQVSYTGSSTIGENIIPEAAKAFTAQTGIEFGPIKIPGSGKGIAAVIRGEAKLAGVSRSLTIEEKKEKLYYQVIGYDAITIFVHKNNPVERLTREEVKGIFTGKITNWKAVGGNDAPIVCITETWGDLRATMIEFQHLAMDGADYRKDRIEVDKPRDQSAYLALEENGIIQVSMVFIRPEIKVISINDVFPEAKNIISGAYLFSRPLLLVTKGLPAGEVKRFIEFIISRKGQEIVAKNFVPVMQGIKDYKAVGLQEK